MGCKVKVKGCAQALFAGKKGWAKTTCLDKTRSLSNDHTNVICKQPVSIGSVDTRQACMGNGGFSSKNSALAGDSFAGGALLFDFETHLADVCLC